MQRFWRKERLLLATFIKIRVTLKEYLAEVGVTAYVLSKWINGVSPQTIYAVCNGTRRPSFEVLEAIVTALRAHNLPVDLSHLIHLEENLVESD